MKFTLDCAKWKCGSIGGRPDTALGTGLTLLLNNQGFMCCLGQFSKQLGFSADQLLGIANPSELQKENIFTKLNDHGSMLCSPLSIEAIGINDDNNTTIDTKIERLCRLFAENGHEIEVINKPETVA